MNDHSFGAAVSAGIRRHAVALISLTVALFGTSYNTWRNQTTEAHRNVRSAGFIVLEQLGQLQQIADSRYYGSDHSDANRIEGWGKVSMLRDTASLISARADTDAQALLSAWKTNVDRLDGSNAGAEEAISKAIVALRTDVLQELRALN